MLNVELAEAKFERSADRDLYWTGPEDDSGRVLVEEKDTRQAFLAIHKGAEVTERWLKQTGCEFRDGVIFTPAQLTGKSKAATTGGEGETDPLLAMSASELKAFLTEKGVAFPGNASKEKLIEIAKSFGPDNGGEGEGGQP